MKKNETDQGKSTGLNPVQKIVICEAIMTIEEGWRFFSADFSVQANGKDKATGIVTLVRAPAEKTRWHKMPEEMKDDGPPLYVIGHGMTLEDAINSANLSAAHAKPISV